MLCWTLKEVLGPNLKHKQMCPQSKMPMGLLRMMTVLRCVPVSLCHFGVSSAVQLTLGPRQETPHSYLLL